MASLSSMYVYINFRTFILICAWYNICGYYTRYTSVYTCICTRMCVHAWYICICVDILRVHVVHIVTPVPLLHLCTCTVYACLSVECVYMCVNESRPRGDWSCCWCLVGPSTADHEQTADVNVLAITIAQGHAGPVCGPAVSYDLLAVLYIYLHGTASVHKVVWLRR